MPHHLPPPRSGPAALAAVLLAATIALASPAAAQGLPLDCREEAELVPSVDPFVTTADLTADGSELLMSVKDPGVPLRSGVLDRATGVLEDLPVTSAWPRAITGDGSQVLFETFDGHYAFHDRTGGTTTTIEPDPDPPNSSLAGMSADGDRLLFRVLRNPFDPTAGLGLGVYDVSGAEFRYLDEGVHSAEISADGSTAIITRDATRTAQLVHLDDLSTTDLGIPYTVTGSIFGFFPQGPGSTARIDGDASHVWFVDTADHDGSNADGSRELWRLDLATTTTEAVTVDAGVSRDAPLPSADGTSVAFLTEPYVDATLAQVWIAEDGEAPRRVWAPPTSEGVASLDLLSADGAWLVAGRGWDDESEVLVDTTDGTRVELFGEAPTTGPSLADQTGAVAFGSARDLDGANPDLASDVWLLEPDDGAQPDPLLQALAPEASSSQPSLSEDGELLAFASDADLDGANPDGNIEVFLADLTEGPDSIDDPGAIEQVTDTIVGDAAEPELSADGSTLVFRSTASIAGSPEGVEEVYRYDVAGETIEQVSPDDDEAGPTRWIGVDRDGDTITFRVRTTLFRWADGGPAALLSGPTSRSPLLLGDGTAMWRINGTNQWFRALPGEGPELVPIPSEVGYLSAATPDGRYVYSPEVSIIFSSSTPAMRFDTANGFAAVELAGDREPRDVGPAGRRVLTVAQNGYDEQALDLRCAVFLDVPLDHPFSDEVDSVAEAGIAGGYADQGFHPGAVVTRQAMAAFLYRLAGEPEAAPPATPTFADVPAEHPFFDEIEWAADQGITTGYPDGGFHPAAVVSRQATAAFLFRLVDPDAFDPPGTPSFADVPAEHPFFDEIEWAAEQGITTGYPDGGFHPAATVTRQAMAAFLARTTEQL